MADLQPLTLANAGQPGILPDKTVNPWMVLRGSNLGAEGMGLQDVAQKGNVILDNYNEGVANSLKVPLQQSLMDQKARAQTLQGQNVLNAGTDESGQQQDYHQSALAAFDQTTQQQMDLAKNDDQRQSIQQDASRWRSDLDAYTSAHQNVELHKASLQATGSVLQGDSNLMVQAMQIGDHGAFATHYADLENHMAQLSALKGSDPDTAKLDRQTILSAAYSHIIGTMLTSPGGYRNAQDFFNGVKDDMNAEAQAKVARAIQAGTAYGQAIPAVQDAISSLTTTDEKTGQTWRPTADQIDKALVDKFRDDPMALEEARKEAAHQNTMWTDGQNALTARAVNAYQATGPQHLTWAQMQMHGWTDQMDGTTQDHVRTAMAQTDKVNQATDPMTDLKQMAAFADFQESPEWLRACSPKTDTATANNIVMAAYGNLGPYTKNAMQLLEQIRTNPGKLQQISVDKDLTETVYRTAKNINPGIELGQQQKTELKGLNVALQTIQQNSGSQWSYENTAKLAKELLVPIVTQKGAFSDTKQSLYQVMLTTPLPPAFIQAASKEADARGYGHLDWSILYQKYLDARSGGLLNDDGSPKPNVPVVPPEAASPRLAPMVAPKPSPTPTAPTPPASMALTGAAPAHPTGGEGLYAPGQEPWANTPGMSAVPGMVAGAASRFGRWAATPPTPSLPVPAAPAPVAQPPGRLGTPWSWATPSPAPAAPVPAKKNITGTFGASKADDDNPFKIKAP